MVSSRRDISAVAGGDAKSLTADGASSPFGTVYLAPLAGYTDAPFRRACRRCGCQAAFTPLIDAGALVYGNRRNRVILHRDPDEPWLGTQVLGSDPERLGQAAARLSLMAFDRIDLNLGCPVKKVTQRGAGAALAEDVEAATRCAQAVVTHAGETEVTAKIRVLDDHDPQPTLALARKLRDAGVQALAIHGRRWERVYSGAVAAGVIRAVAGALDIPVIANGGIFCRQDAVDLCRETGCADLMVARGAIGNPWVFREIQDPEAPPPTHMEVCEVLHEHVAGMVALYGEDIAMRNGRKIILAYLCGRGYRRNLRAEAGKLATMAAFEALLSRIREEGPTEGFRPDQGRPAITFVDE